MSLQDFLNSFDNTQSLHTSFTICWTEHGRGFGQYRFYVSEDGKVHIDNECDGKESIKRIVCRLIDEAVLDDIPFAELKAQREKEEQEKQNGTHNNEI
ncbi:MAG: hypothetical protein EO766_11930 [Hydrotalea sp. AMD]|uniref:hypothetical protein n=1 Tax=Hydrotalea sp. AMD TaxID=2501297 RepID=UPI0010281917|nr:hypothetical protein [Hydrotalea sp. AMD]RWZ87228.1 MAG: hypothetical protein EO766_11930 [Hydrotalea sp. AMD]